MLYLHPERSLQEIQGLCGSVLVSEGCLHHKAEGRHVVGKELKNIYVYVNASIMCIQ